MYIASLLLAIRSRFPALSLSLVLGMIVVAWCAAEFSGRQPATVALDVGLSFVRFSLPIMAILLVQELLFREGERRHYLYSLTYPSSRSHFFLSRMAAIFSLLLVFLLMMTVTLALIVKWVSLDYAQATPVGLDWKYYTTVAFVAVDVLVIASFAAVLAIFASSPGFILLGTMGFVLTARSYAAVIGMLSQNSTLVDDAASYQAGLGVLGYFLPNLGWLDVRGVALYGHWDFLPVDWLMGLLGLVLYAVFLVGVAIWGLQHKRFA